MSAVPSSARRWANRWLDHRLGVPDREMRLSYRRIFILPSRGGLLFAERDAAEVNLGGGRFQTRFSCGR